MLRRSRYALVLAVALAWGCDQDGATALRVKTPARPVALATAVGSIIDLGNLPGAASAAINGRGQVGGFGRIRGGLVDHAFLWTPDVPNGTTGSMTDLGTLPGGSGSAAFGVNDRGQVVGCSYTNFCDPTNGSAFL